MTLTGDKELIRNLKNLGPKARKGAKRGLVTHGELVATDAKRRTPVDTGALRSTLHRRDGQDLARQALEQWVVAGPLPSNAIDTGPANKYAIAVHENLQARHKVGEAKYLQNAMNSLAGMMEKIVGRAIKKALRL